MPEWQRTHTCGEIREANVGQSVVLNGWVNTVRSYNAQVFIDLRDRYGITQVVVDADDADLFRAANEVGREFVLAVSGVVEPRLPEAVNPKLVTGKIEVKARRIQVLNRSPNRPFEVTEFPDEPLANEDVRLQYRYLDLRRRTLQETLIVRHRLCKTIRDYLDAKGFLEVETPLLGRSTPEGARDYLVPSRVFPGEFYALPQSPQLYKQLLMVAGYDKYFQIARCLRDEDLRADRQPEFTQLDLEMSFVTEEDIFRVIEGLVGEIFKRTLGLEIPLPLPRIPYAEAMLRYGSDKPDLRFGMEIVDVGDIAAETDFQVFREALAAGGKVRGLNAKGAAEKFTRKGIDELAAYAGRYGAKGLAWVKVEAGQFAGGIANRLPAPVQQALRERMGAEAGDLLLFVADKEDVVCAALGALRSHLGGVLGLYRNWWDRKADLEEKARKEEKEAKKQKRAPRPTEQFSFKPDDFKLAWIVDFPSFIWDEEEKRWVANHHPFTAPRDEDLPFLESDPGRVKAKAYDLVMNGYEVGGGSIRIHDPEVQSCLFAVLGMSREDAQQRFGFLLDALQFGAPPHGGIALGVDRWAMMLAGTTNIRDVIAFPKNQKARDLMTNAPAPVEPRQLKELGLK